MPNNSDVTLKAVPNVGVDRRREGDFAERVGRDLKSAADLLARFGHVTAEAKARQLVGQSSQMNAVRDRPWDLEGLASRIASNAAKFLGAETIDPGADFFDLGGTSVNAVELVSQLSRELGVQLSLDDLFADARPRQLAERWLGRSGAALAAVLTPPPSAPVALNRTSLVSAPTSTQLRPDNVDDNIRAIEADLELANALPWVESPAFEAPRKILLTGTTGFLGGQLLFDLLRRSDAHVVCLVRAADDRLATERLKEQLKIRDLPWSSELARRITVVAGDMQRPLLGLSQERWDSLAAEVDSVVNVAAAVDFLRGYQSLRRSNVLAVLTLATFATTGRIKPLHQVSTVSVFDELGIRAMGEDDPVGHADRLFAGYETSKWAAEAVLRRARDRGLVVSMFRPGGIGGHTVTGAYNPHDLNTGFMAAWQMLRALPEFRHLHVAPVDWVSRIIAEVVLDPEAWGHNYHLTGVPLTLPDVVRNMTLGGMNIRVLSFEEWRQYFLARMESDPIPHLEYLTRVLTSPTALKLIEATLSAPASDARRTEAFIKRKKLPPPPTFNARAMIAMSERLARDGRGKLPDRDDPPYLQFAETMKGKLGPVDGVADATCVSKLTLSVASFYQVVKERRIDIRGELHCPLLHAEPLLVESGDLWVRPNDGVPERHGLEHPLLRYALVLRAVDGRRWWLQGMKTARPGRDMWRQGRTLRVELGEVDKPASFAGELVVPPESYLPEQIDGIQVNQTAPQGERGLAKLIWLAWFGAQFSLGFSEPMLRSIAQLFDARPGYVAKKGETR